MGSLPPESACANGARSTVSHGSSPSVHALRLLTVAPAQRAKGFADGAVFLTVMHCYEDISPMIAERGGKVGGEIGRAESSEQALRESATAAARSSAVTSTICTSVDHASESTVSCACLASERRRTGA
jgi:hypothetical protein